MSSFYTMMFLLPLIALSHASTRSCSSLAARRQSYVGFNFRNTTNTTSGTFVTLNARYNSLYAQLVQYENGLYGHFVSFSDNNENQYYNNGTLVAVQYTSLDCRSLSYKPKELSRLWVKSYDGLAPFDWDVNQTSSTFTGSVTLKCSTPSCYYYDFVTGNSYSCSNTSNGNLTSTNPPSTLQVKFNFTLNSANQEYMYAYSCSSMFVSKNSTTECAYPSSFAYYGRDVMLTTQLNSLKLSTANVNDYIPKVSMATLDSSYSSYNENVQYFSVCGEGCSVIPVSR